MKDINFLNSLSKEPNKPQKNNVPNPEKGPKKNLTKKLDLSSSDISTKDVLIILAVVVVLVLGFIAPLLVLMTKEGQVEKITNELNSPKYMEIKELNAKIVEEDKKLAVKKTVTEKIEQSVHPLSQVLLAIRNATPANCVVNQMSVKGNALEFDFTADNGYVAAEFIANIDRLTFLTLKNQETGLDLTDSTSPVSMQLSVAIGGKDG